MVWKIAQDPVFCQSQETFLSKGTVYKLVLKSSKCNWIKSSNNSHSCCTTSNNCCTCNGLETAWGFLVPFFKLLAYLIDNMDTSLLKIQLNMQKTISQPLGH